jgi:hypothetical protein
VVAPAVPCGGPENAQQSRESEGPRAGGRSPHYGQEGRDGSGTKIGEPPNLLVGWGPGEATAERARFIWRGDVISYGPLNNQ